MKIYVVGVYYGEGSLDCGDLPLDLDKAYFSKDLAEERAKEIGGEVFDLDIMDGNG